MVKRKINQSSNCVFAEKWQSNYENIYALNRMIWNVEPLENRKWADKFVLLNEKEKYN